MSLFLTSALGWLTDISTELIPKILAAVIVSAIGILLIRLVMKLLTKALERSKLEKAAYSLVKTVVRTVLGVLLALIAASSLGIDVTGVVALASVATLAVSLALQNMLANVIGGFTLLYTHPFKSGDYVEIVGQSGTVTEIGMSYTKLNTPDNKMISIPNSAVVAAQIVNYTALGSRRAEISVRASYDVPAQKVIETLLAVAQDERILTEPAAPFAALTNYEDSAIRYVLRFWTNGSDYWDVYFKINRDIKEAFEKAGVQMTYNHLNVHLDK